MLALYVAVWSLATVGMGFVNGLAAIFLLRFVLGVFQAGAYPTAASVIKRWFPYNTRGRASSAVSMGRMRGGLLAFAITPCANARRGPRSQMGDGPLAARYSLYGVLGLVWVAVFVWLYRDSPCTHPWCNEAEAELIAPATGLHHLTHVPRSSRADHADEQRNRPHVRDWLLRRRRLGVPRHVAP